MIVNYVHSLYIQGTQITEVFDDMHCVDDGISQYYSSVNRVTSNTCSKFRSLKLILMMVILQKYVHHTK